MASVILLILLAALPSLSEAQATGGNLSNCRGGCALGELCVSNPFLQPGVTDDQCLKCAGGREYWPCNFETVCHCSSIEAGAPRVPPAPRSGARVNEEVDVCRDVLTEEVFNKMVRPATLEGNVLFTYRGLCDAIAQYNRNHDEKFAGMGSEEQIRRELAAFLAHTAVDTFGYSVTREELHCVDPITGTDGNVYCKPCKEEHYNPQTKACSQSYFASGNPSYEAYCDATRQPPSGCACDSANVRQVTVPVPAEMGNANTDGYVRASEAYFKRGALQTDWNYAYYGASLAMTGTDFLCDNPDLVATDPVYAWGVAVAKWMEQMIFGTQGSTAHKQALKGNFGGAVKVLYGALECPSDKWTSAVHVDMVKDRVSQICTTGSALGVYLEMFGCDNPRDGDCLECEGLKEIYDTCLVDGSCPDCPRWTEFLRSSAPTVTPLRVESPTWDDWASNYGSRSSARRDASLWTAVASVLLLSVGTLLTVF